MSVVAYSDLMEGFWLPIELLESKLFTSETALTAYILFRHSLERSRERNEAGEGITNAMKDVGIECHFLSRSTAPVVQ